MVDKGLKCRHTEKCIHINPLPADHDYRLINLLYYLIKSLILGMKLMFNPFTIAFST